VRGAHHGAPYDPHSDRRRPALAFFVLAAFAITWVVGYLAVSVAELGALGLGDTLDEHGGGEVQTR
jgi:hypothetical protein